MGVLAQLLFFGPFLVHFGATGGESSLGAFFTLLRAPHCYSLGAHLLFVGPFWGVGPTNGPFWRNTSAASPRFYTRATLAHFWRTPQAAHRLYWRTSGAHPKSPIAYIRATLACFF